MQPFFSICIPTGNRPNFVEMVLYALSVQSFSNFEVILSDNSTNDLSRKIYEKYKKKINIKYFFHRDRKSIIENFEFSITQTSGKYVLLNTDKTYLYPFSLEYVHKEISAEPTLDIVSFSLDHLTSLEKISNPLELRFYYNQKNKSLYNPLRILKKLLDYSLPLNLLPYSIQGYGCMQYSFISKAIITKIVKSYGQYFYPVSLDYSSLVLPLYLAQKGLKINISLGMYNNNPKKSLGNSIATNYDSTRRYIQELDRDNLYPNYAIFPEFLTSMHNMIISDMLYRAKKVNLLPKDFLVNKKRLLLNVYQDLKKQQNVPNETIEQIEHLYRNISPFFKSITKIQTKLLTKYSASFLWQYVCINTLGHFKIGFYGKLYKHRAMAKQPYQFKNFKEAIAFSQNYYCKNLLDLP